MLHTTVEEDRFVRFLQENGTVKMGSNTIILTLSVLINLTVMFINDGGKIFQAFVTYEI